ncbi:hypothetical protein QJS10_CPA07g00969 [Acorus calamus]|uniref:Reverse transcriptase zinc-binding domain-containing protein n=1 Tax=Acorus calamus TaxID=4465 RepID=A0AAV9EGH8_ACOCL|nr:hypothetical protein QJS10_CPA07g00969 [Acorus calamus]
MVRYLSFKNGKGRVAIKLGLRKAFDSIHWPYLYRLLWGGPTLKKTIHHVKWDAICTPKAEGELGIRRISDWMRAATGARLWEVLTGSESLWVAWITKRYLSKQQASEVPLASAGSWAWPHILATRTWIHPEVRYIIFSGHSIRVWLDPWIRGSSLQQRTQLFGPLDPSYTVEKLINGGSWIKPAWWPNAWSKIWEDILAQDCGGDGEDILVWPHSVSGMLTTTSAWNFLRHQQERPKWCTWICKNSNHQSSPFVRG